jgi:cyanophycin synthetase
MTTTAVSMHIIEQRFLRGPNLYGHVPCLMTVLDPGALADTPVQLLRERQARLAGLLPELEAHAADALAGAASRCVRDGDPAGWVYMLAMVQRELQRLAGGAHQFDVVHVLPGSPVRYRLVSGYTAEALAADALAAAIALMTAIAEEAAFDVADTLAALRTSAARQEVSPATAKVLSAAQERGVPVLTLGETPAQFQLGWGSLQTRIVDDATALQADSAGSVFPQGDGRIPVIAVTGTNGKTTTVLMLAHTVQLAGMRCGLTTTEGVYIGGERVFKGDCSGYWSARRVLTSPEVDFAVLETARGGILKRGLAFDRCDVGVVLNVSADHLGLDGIDTVRDLAVVKGLVAQVASRAVVLNAEDMHCTAMAGRLDPAVEVLYFSLDPDHPVLLRHLEQGGRAAYLQDGTVVLADGSRRHALLNVNAMPSSLGGHARYNIANGMAAAAALLASGFNEVQIAAGLSSFVSDHQNNPLRSNVFHLRESGVTLIVDYAHNAAAYTAVGQAARSMAQRRVIGVVTAPGDRRDVDLHEIGRACGSNFDQLLVYESSRRGRAPGATGELIVRGIAQSGGVCKAWRQIDDVREALAYALVSCQAGDVLVYSCPGTLEYLHQALLAHDTEAAAMVADLEELPCR